MIYVCGKRKVKLVFQVDVVVVLVSGAGQKKSMAPRMLDPAPNVETVSVALADSRVIRRVIKILVILLRINYNLK